MENSYQEMINKAQSDSADVATPDGNTSIASETPTETPQTTEPAATAPVVEPTVILGETPEVTETPTEIPTGTPQGTAEPQVTETPNVRVIRKGASEEPDSPETKAPQEGFISLEELEQRKLEWQKEANTPQESFFDERSKAIDAHLRAGGELDAKFWKYQTSNLDNIDLSNTDVNTAIDLIKQELTDVQGYSKDESELQIKRKYPHLYRGVEDEDNAQEVENYNDDKTQVGMDVKKSLDSLKQFRDSVKLPDPTPVGPSKEEVAAKEARLNEYVESAKQAVSSFTKFDVEVNAEVSLEMLVDKEQTESLTQIISNPNNLDNYFFNEYVDNGKTDFERMASDLHFLKNRQTIIKSIVNQALAIGKEEALKETGKAPTLKGAQVQSQGRTNVDPGNTWLSQLRN